MAGRLLSYACAAVAVAWEGEDAGGIAAFLFGAFPAPGPGAEPTATYLAGPGKYPDLLVLQRDGVPVWRGEDAGALAEVWLGAVSHDLADRSRGGMLFHAAALRTPAGGLLLPGGIGAGKTTLALWLAARGAGYRTDEMVFVPEGSCAAAPCPRPLNLKRGSLEPLRGVFDPSTAYSLTLEGPLGMLVSPEALSPGEPQGPLPLALAVFPHYEAGASPALERLSKAETGLALMGCLVNARNLPGHGHPEAARLARSVPGWRLRYSSFEQLAPLLGLLRLG
jgi:hypothetical protein